MAEAIWSTNQVTRSEQAQITMYKLIDQLRIVGILEGISFLALLFVAMPLKYGFGMPIAVTIAGSIHGFLFTLYVIAMVRCTIEFEWTTQKWLKVLIAAVYPFGTFILEPKLKEESQSLRQKPELVAGGVK